MLAHFASQTLVSINFKMVLKSFRRFQKVLGVSKKLENVFKGSSKFEIVPLILKCFRRLQKVLETLRNFQKKSYRKSQEKFIKASKSFW
jgi:hypothetical protein